MGLGLRRGRGLLLAQRLLKGLGDLLLLVRGQLSNDLLTLGGLQDLEHLRGLTCGDLLHDLRAEIALLLRHGDIGLASRRGKRGRT